MRTIAAHSGAAYEAGQLGHRNGAAPEGTQVVNAREDPDTVRRPADTLLLLGSGDVPGTFRTAGSRTRSRNVPNAGRLPFRPAYGGARFWLKNGRSPLVNACVRTLHTLSQPRRASIAAEHDRSGAPEGRQC